MRHRYCGVMRHGQRDRQTRGGRRVRPTSLFSPSSKHIRYACPHPLAHPPTYLAGGDVLHEVVPAVGPQEGHLVALRLQQLQHLCSWEWVWTKKTKEGIMSQPSYIYQDDDAKPGPSHHIPMLHAPWPRPPPGPPYTPPGAPAGPPPTPPRRAAPCRPRRGAAARGGPLPPSPPHPAA